MLSRNFKAFGDERLNISGYRSRVGFGIQFFPSNYLTNNFRKLCFPPSFCWQDIAIIVKMSPENFGVKTKSRVRLLHVLDFRPDPLKV